MRSSGAVSKLSVFPGGFKVPDLVKVPLSKVNQQKQKPLSIRLSHNHVEQVSVGLEENTKDDSSRYDKLPYLRKGLERVLYQPINLHQLKDSRSGVYNFDPSLETVTSALPPVSSSKGFKFPYKDNALLNVALKHEQKYISSTSSMTALLSQFHFLFSNFRKLNITNSSISKNFPQRSCNFTRGAQFPASVIIRKIERDVNSKNVTVCSIDSDPSLDREMILSTLGHTLEEFLTRGGRPDGGSDNIYHYSKIDQFIIRSQLDCYDSKLPGSKVFDLKTRAVSAIRYDLSYVEQNNNYTGYQIDKIYGPFESLEREFFDLIRSSLLKYSLQARMGKMDGIFVAYHNISNIFGFQYVPLDEMDYIIHSDSDFGFRNSLRNREQTLSGIYGRGEYIINHEYKEREIASLVADTEFKMSTVLLRNVLNHIESQFKLNRINWSKAKIIMKTLPGDEPVLKIVALPLYTKSEHQIEALYLNKCSSPEEVLQQVQKIRDYNKNMIRNNADEVLGFEVRIKNTYKRHRDSIIFPDYISDRNSPSLNYETNRFLEKQLNRDYYRYSPDWSHPNFVDPLDVSTWKATGNIKQVEDRSEIQNLYMSFIEEKLYMIEQECNESINNSKNELEKSPRFSKERLKKFMESKRNISKIMHEKELNGGDRYDEFRSTLRAYGEKGSQKKRVLTFNS